MNALLLALALLAPAPPCAREETNVILGEVEMRVRFVWPEELRRGYFPLQVELENGGEREVEARVSAELVLGTDSVEKRVALAPGETLRFDLLGRAEPNANDEYVLILEVGGERRAAEWLGPARSERTPRRALLVLRAERGSADLPESWRKPLGDKESDFAIAAFDDMAERHEAYSSLDAVLLDSARGMPGAEQLAPLLAWTRLGGTLVLYGPSAAREARALPALAAWCEPRFLVDEDAALGARAYAFAHGRLVTLDREQALDRPEAGAFLLRHFDGLHAAPGWVPGLAEARHRSYVPSESPTAAMPLRALAAILVLFALLIGPANFVLVRRLAKPVLLLVTVPGIALVAAALLLGYGILAQGLDVRLARASFTVLDQRAHQASTAASMLLFAGRSPGEGLRPAPGSSVHVERKAPSRGRRRHEQRFRMDLTGGLLLAGDYLPVRNVYEALALSDAPARARLDFVAEGEGLAVTNGLGAELLSLVLHDAEGRWHRLDAPLAEGARARLSVGTPGRDGEELVAAMLAGASSELPRGCYAARLARSPFADDCGLAPNEVRGSHGLLGVLPLGAEAAR